MSGSLEFTGEWVGKRARSSPPVCSSCKKIKLAASNGTVLPMHHIPHLLSALLQAKNKWCLQVLQLQAQVLWKARDTLHQITSNNWNYLVAMTSLLARKNNAILLVNNLHIIHEMLLL